ncbi:MAG: hypothetical protein WED10_01765 [Brumimicrobium sp.]
MYPKFREELYQFPVFTRKEIDKKFDGFDYKNLINWQKKGYITKVRNNYYIFSDKKKDENFLFHIANAIYPPSYISLESALSYYNIIPEGVYTMTSVSTLKTNKFNTPLGDFDYAHIKNQLFFGYKIVNDSEIQFKIATLEKTILDYLYLHPKVKNERDIEALRWNTDLLEKLDQQLLESYLVLFQSATLERKIKNLIDYIYA